MLVYATICMWKGAVHLVWPEVLSEEDLVMKPVLKYSGKLAAGARTLFCKLHIMHLTC